MLTNLLYTVTICSFLVTCSCKHIFVINSFPERSDDNLVSVVVLYRHGNRSPTASFPNDPYYNSSYWPEGYGQLLKEGILNQYNLGEWLRNRYEETLPAEYSANDILVYSTDVDRTLMSAQANLAGLYPPPESQMWDDDLLWEPIPVHRMATDDPVLTMNSACPKHDKLQKELEKSDFFKNITEENKDLFNTLSKLTGMNVSSTGDIQKIYDTLYVYRNHNETYLPSWVADVDLEKLKYLAGLQMGKPAFTDELRRLRAGPYFDYLINHFESIINNTDTTKMLMLSAHDSTVSTVLSGMGAYDYQPPEFTATVIWELRTSDKSSYYINVLYKRNSSDAVEKLKVFNCDFDCTFVDFEENLASVRVDSATWEKECSGSVQILISWSLILVAVVFQRLV